MSVVAAPRPATSATSFGVEERLRHSPAYAITPPAPARAEVLAKFWRPNSPWIVHRRRLLGPGARLPLLVLTTADTNSRRHARDRGAANERIVSPLREREVGVIRTRGDVVEDRPQDSSCPLEVVCLTRSDPDRRPRWRAAAPPADVLPCAMTKGVGGVFVSDVSDREVDESAIGSTRIIISVTIQRMVPWPVCSMVRGLMSVPAATHAPPWSIRTRTVRRSSEAMVRATLGHP